MMKYVGAALLLLIVIALAAGYATGMLQMILQLPVDTSEIDSKFENLAYGSVSETQTLNIYHPNDGEGPFPVIVVIHGGGFMMGSATSGDLSPMFEGVNRGYALASVNYRLSSEATFPAAVNDVRAAVRFLKANAEQYNLDADRMAVWGASAGANLASMVGTTAQVDALNGDTLENLDQSSAVQAVVDWFGPIEFLTMDAQFDALGIEPALGATDREGSPESRYIGTMISAEPILTNQANPTTYIDTMDPATAPQFFIQHGTADANVPILQSENFANALRSAIGDDKVAYHIIEGAGHGTDEFSTKENLDLIFGFLDGVLKR